MIHILRNRGWGGGYWDPQNVLRNIYERSLFVPCIEKLIPSRLLWDKPIWCSLVHQGSSHLDDSSDIRIQRSEPDNKEGRWQRQSLNEEMYHVKDAKDCTKYKERAGRRLHPLLFLKSIQSVLWSLYPETSQIGRKRIPSWKWSTLETIRGGMRIFWA